MNTNLMDSTRRYKRSTMEAFADERAHCIEGPDKHARADKAVAVTLVLAFVFLVALLAWEAFA